MIENVPGPKIAINNIILCFQRKWKAPRKLIKSLENFLLNSFASAFKYVHYLISNGGKNSVIVIRTQSCVNIGKGIWCGSVQDPQSDIHILQILWTCKRKENDQCFTKKFEKKKVFFFRDGNPNPDHIFWTQKFRNVNFYNFCT